MSNIELRGAAIDAAAESATHHDSGTPPTGICNERDAAGNAAQSAPHHSRTEQEHADSVARSGEPAPAREPVHNDWSKAKAKVLAKYPAAQYEAMQGYLPPYGHIVWINHKRDAPSDRGYGLSNATSEQEAWLEAARNLPAPAREPAVEEAEAALRERSQGGVVVSEEVAAQFPGDITIPKALLAEAYRGLKRHYEMPEVRREIDRLLAAAKERGNV